MILMGSPNVKNYTQYIELLKAEFDGIDEIPSDEDLTAFLDKYELYDDWKIVISDVKLDIIRELLPHLKKEKIYSYKSYLEKIKLSFGIPEEMPEDDQICDFIDKYCLESMWGITSDDVKEDLRDIINGKYDEMYAEAIRRRKTNQRKPVQNTYNYHKPVVSSYNPTVNQRPVYRNNITNTQTTNSANKKPKKTNRNHKQNTESTTQENILIDGDNHFDEGQKGIEHTSKNTNVVAYFSQLGAKRKFDKKHKKRSNVSSKFVKPGDQAVDNAIKSDAGRIIKDKKEKVTIVSQDKGFENYRDKKNKKSSKNNIRTAKSVDEAIKKKKK